MNAEIMNLVNQYPEDCLFVKADLSEKMISAAEKELGFKLPQEFVEYVQQLGYGGIGGVDILGVGLIGNMVFLDTTIEYRAEGLPYNLLVFECADEWLNCIDSNTGNVVEWHYDGNIVTLGLTFDEFILNQFKDAIENL